MINVKINFTIKSNVDLEEVKTLIREFIEQIQDHETGTLIYKSFYCQENPRKFFHLMTFVDAKAQQFHRNSTYCHQFVAKLYPLCAEPPSPQDITEIEL